MAHQDTTPDKPSHTPGTPRGEELAGGKAKDTNRREDDATGISLNIRGPISPKMPHFPPA